MAKSSKKALHDSIRAHYMDIITKALTDSGDEILRVGSQEIAVPCVDPDGNDEYLVLTFRVPTGTRDGEAYDGYSMAEDYALKCKEKAEKAKIAAAEKARKIEKDVAMRAQKAAAKAAREEKNAEG